MRIYLWESVEGLTYNYHSGGALLVVAKSLSRARQIAAEKIYDKSVVLDKPDQSWTTTDYAKETVFIFPDAGCC